LWWAFQAAGAYEQQKIYDSTRRLSPELSRQPLTRGGTVILIDEIDKADPDVPNNLLVALGSLQFKVDETGQTIHADKARPHLIFVTTNEERELPAAFLRRCIAITLPALPGNDRDGSMRKKLLVDIVLAHGITHASQKLSRSFVEGIAQMLSPVPKPDALAVVPSPAEFKDTVLALVDQYGDGNIPESALEEIAQMTLSKR
jgi:MoxR-like ATPase